MVIGSDLRRASTAEAEAAIGALCCANDVTARDLQNTEQQWTRAKGFDTFCVLGIPSPFEGDLAAVQLTTKVNGAVRQQGKLADLIFSIPYLLSYISQVMTLRVGDVVLTGTPEGVGPLVEGDEVEVVIPGVGSIRNGVRAEVPGA